MAEQSYFIEYPTGNGKMSKLENDTRYHCRLPSQLSINSVPATVSTMLPNVSLPSIIQLRNSSNNSSFANVRPKEDFIPGSSLSYPPPQYQTNSKVLSSPLSSANQETKSFEPVQISYSSLSTSHPVSSASLPLCTSQSGRSQPNESFNSLPPMFYSTTINRACVGRSVVPPQSSDSSRRHRFTNETSTLSHSSSFGPVTHSQVPSSALHALLMKPSSSISNVFSPPDDYQINSGKLDKSSLFSPCIENRMKNFVDKATSTFVESTSQGVQTLSTSPSECKSEITILDRIRQCNAEEFNIPASQKSVGLNQRLQNVHSFPKYRGRHFDRRLMRNGITLCAKSTMRMLRQFLQQKINQEMDKVLEFFMEEYFYRATANIQRNLGEDAFTKSDLVKLKYRIMKRVLKTYLPPFDPSTDRDSDAETSSDELPIQTDAKSLDVFPTSETDIHRSCDIDVQRNVMNSQNATISSEVVDSCSASEYSSVSSNHDEEHLSLILDASPVEKSSHLSDIIPWSEVIGDSSRECLRDCENSSVLSSQSSSVITANATVAAYCLMNDATSETLPANDKVSEFEICDITESPSRLLQARKRKYSSGLNNDWINLSKIGVEEDGFLQSDHSSPPATSLPTATDVFFSERDINYLLCNDPSSSEAARMNGCVRNQISSLPQHSLPVKEKSPPVLYRFDSYPSPNGLKTAIISTMTDPSHPHLFHKSIHKGATS